LAQAASPAQATAAIACVVRTLCLFCAMAVVPVLAAAGGAAAGGAVVATGHYLNGLAERYTTAKHKEQSLVVSELVRKSLSSEQVLLPAGFDLEDLRLTLVELSATAPAYPPMKLAFDAIHVYQSQRKGSTAFGVMRTHRRGSATGADADPRTVTCELLKYWIREKIQDRDIDACEVFAYRNFCRGFLNYPAVFKQRNRMSFCRAMAHVACHLDEVLWLRLRDLRSGTQLFERLHGEAYHFVLHALKIPILVASHIEAPNVQYSLDSLALLRRTALPTSLLTSEFHKRLAEKMESAWQTDCGRLIRLLLSTPHMERLSAAREGPLPSEEATVPWSVVVQRAENLPKVQRFENIAPYVKVKVMRNGQRLGKATTSVRNEDCNPRWDERLFVELPANDSMPSAKNGSDADSAICVEVSDHRTMTQGHFSTKFAHSAPLHAPLVRALAEEGREVRLALKPCSSKVSQQQLQDSALFVCFERPRFDLEIEALRKRWRDNGGCRATSTGLRFPGAGPVFLAEVEALEHLVYFLDIGLSQCSELARLLGDLGVVLMAPVLAILFDEIEQRVGVTEAAAAAVLDVVYGTQVELVKLGKGGPRSIGCLSGNTLRNAERMREAEQSLVSLRDLKRRMLETSSELRHVCHRYGGVGGLLSEATHNAQQLMSRLQDSDTARRSSRFSGMLSDIVNKQGADATAGMALLQGVVNECGTICNGDADEDSD